MSQLKFQNKLLEENYEKKSKRISRKIFKNIFEKEKNRIY
ncbi:hypothetical protein M2142_000972, partial [Fusobacterium sp. PH5-29]